MYTNFNLLFKVSKVSFQEAEVDDLGKNNNLAIEKSVIFFHSKKGLNPFF